MKQIKRSGMIADTIKGYHLAALDGTEFFRSAVIHCKDGMAVHLLTASPTISTERCDSTMSGLHSNPLSLLFRFCPKILTPAIGKPAMREN